MTEGSRGNNPYQEPQRTFKNRERQPSPTQQLWPENERHDAPRCEHCDKPMRHGRLVVEIDGERLTSDLEGLGFCGEKCLRRRLQGLNSDDDAAMRTLQDRYDDARDRLRLYATFEEEVSAHNRAVRSALTELRAAAPALADGKVPGAAGGVVRQKLTTLQQLANRPPVSPS